MGDRNEDEYYEEIEAGQMAEDQTGDDFASFDARRYLRGRGHYLGEEREELEYGVGRRSRRDRYAAGEDDLADAGAPGARSSRIYGASGGRRRRTARGDMYENERNGVFELVAGLLLEPGFRTVILGLGCLAVFLVCGCGLLVILLLRQ